MLLSEVGFAVFISFFPSCAMLLASVLMMSISMDTIIEAMLENFSAGLMLAAVSGELFPLIQNIKGNKCIIGTSLGFIFALCLIYGMDYIIGKFEGDEHEESAHGTEPEPVEISFSGKYDPDELKNTIINKLHKSPSYTMTMSGKSNRSIGSVEYGDWDDEPIKSASKDIANPKYKGKIKNLVNKIYESIVTMEQKASSLSSDELSISHLDELAEDIDREAHSVQYVLDQCRRLVEGARKPDGDKKVANIAEEKRIAICERLFEVKHIIAHIQEHLHSDHIDKETLREIHSHIDEADDRMLHFHDSVQHGFSKWRRSRPFPPTVLGSSLPIGMIIPVLIDSFTDGFLIGVACALSTQAGIILAVANCIEMSMLGMALSARVSKCTGSPVFTRYSFICSPPAFILCGTAVGAYLGDISRSNIILFQTFVTFGIVALTYLACNELLIEARELQAGKNHWWVSIMIFLAVYLVIILDGVIPG